MPDSLDDHELCLPCPTCDYDLRAQADPRCAECGKQFTSIEELRVLALDVNRVFNRVLTWRVRFAFAYAGAMVWTIIILGIGGSLLSKPSTAATVMVVLGILPLAAMPFIAGLLFVQVLRISVDSRIAKRQRRQLGGTFPLLIVYMLPGLLFVPLLISMLTMRHVPVGAGV